MTLTLPRGIRNNNPGNIEKVYREDGSLVNNWQGRTNTPVNGQKELDPRFETFENIIFGMRATVVLLLNYYDKHGLNTVEKIINRWAPPNENNTDAYVNSVIQKISQYTGLPAKEEINLHNYDIMKALLMAIIHHENGKHYAHYGITEYQIDQSLILAGLKRKDKAVIVTDKKTMNRRVNAQAIGISTGGMAVALETANVITQTKSAFDNLFAVGGIIFGIISVLFIAYNLSPMVKEYIDATKDWVSDKFSQLNI